MFDRFSEKAIRSIVLAQQEARRYCHSSVGTEHILLGILGEGSGVGARVLKAKVDIGEVRAKVETLVGRGLAAPTIELPFTPRARAILQIAEGERDRLGHKELDTGHILWALLPEDHLDLNAGSVAARALEDLGIDCADIREKVMELLQDPDEADDPQSDDEKFVDMPSMYSSPAGTAFKSDEISCPHCCETIKAGASICRHCCRVPGDSYRRCDSCAEWIQQLAKVCRYCASGLKQ